MSGENEFYSPTGSESGKMVLLLMADGLVFELAGVVFVCTFLGMLICIIWMKETTRRIVFEEESKQRVKVTKRCATRLEAMHQYATTTLPEVRERVEGSVFVIRVNGVCSQV